MAFRIEVIVRCGWVPDGVGGSGLVQSQANIPGAQSGLNPATGFNAQVLQGMQAEGVVAVSPDAPTATEFHTAMILAATDLNTNFFTAANVTTMQNWATGSP